MSLMMQAGLIDYWNRRNSPAMSAMDKCTDSRLKRNERKLTLDDLQSAFLILAIGLTSALVAYLLEIICFAVKMLIRPQHPKRKVKLKRIVVIMK